MARLYADENFDARACPILRALGHDVLTSKQAGHGGLGMSDPEVLEFARLDGRAVVTFNRKDFLKLHGQTQGVHAGIVVCTLDRDFDGLARRIDLAITAEGENLDGKVIRVVRPQ